MIDRTKPIEAVRKSDGLIFPVTFLRREGEYVYTYECPNFRETNDAWKEDGADCCSWDKWYIRNVQEPNIDYRTATGHDLDQIAEEFGIYRGNKADHELRDQIHIAKMPPACPKYGPEACDIIRALLQYSNPMGGLLGAIAREAGERYLND